MSPARRYFRLLKWHESFAFAYEYINGTMGPLEFLQMSKWSLLGIYYFVEMLDIVCSHDIAPTALIGVDKCDGNYDTRLGLIPRIRGEQVLAPFYSSVYHGISSSAAVRTNTSNGLRRQRKGQHRATNRLDEGL